MHSTLRARPVACGMAAMILAGIAAASDDGSVTLSGTIRDFRIQHPDFDVVPASGIGHDAGTIMTRLDRFGRPVFAPGTLARRVDSFVIEDSVVIPSESFAVQVQVLGAAIQYGEAYHLPVTMQIGAGGATHHPFGQLTTPVHANVNDDQTVTGWQNPGSNPRTFIVPNVFDANTGITVLGRSWRLDHGSGLENAHWAAEMTVDTAGNDPQVRVLRDGDPVPTLSGQYDQASAAAFVADYIDFDHNVMDLGPNQIIYLYELGEHHTAATADFQDLVVLVSLATDPVFFTLSEEQQNDISNETYTAAGFRVQSDWTDVEDRAIAPHLHAYGTTDACGEVLADRAGDAGAASDGGISSVESFNQWFRDVPGTNLAMRHPITLTDDGTGVYAFIDDSFHPVDGELFGNEGQAHNNHWTYAITATFTYESCTDQFIEFRGGDGAWIFIGSQLGIDLGGVGSTGTQRVDLDRLGLVDGETYAMRLFYANRKGTGSVFRLRTNLFFTPSDFTVSGGYD